MDRYWPHTRLALMALGLLAALVGLVADYILPVANPDALGGRQLTLIFLGLTLTALTGLVHAWRPAWSQYLALDEAREQAASLLRFTVQGHMPYRLLLLLGGGLVLAASSRTIPHSMADDAFYYLLCGLNFWEYGYLTFDGLTHTNGVQPLWMLITTVFAFPFWLTGTELAFPYFIVVFNFFLALYLLQVVFSILAHGLCSPWIAALTALLAVSAWPLFMLSGMEANVESISFALIVAYVFRVMRREFPLNTVVFAGLSFALLMSRLDNGIWLMLLYVILLPFAGLRPVFQSGVLMTLASLPYFLFNKVAHGHAVPISGRVKRFWNDLVELEGGGAVSRSLGDVYASPNFSANLQNAMGYALRAVQEFFNVLTFGNVPVAYRAVLFAREPQYMASAKLLLAVLGVAFLVWHVNFLRKRGKPDWTFGLYALVLATMAFFGFRLFYYNFLQHIFAEYYGAVSVMVLFCLMALALFSFIDYWPRAFARAVSIGLFAVLAAWLVYSRFVPPAEAERRFYNSHIHGNYMRLVEAIEEHVPPGERVGSWAAGVIGYYSDRSVVNLEGLVADEEMFAYNRDNDIASYIAEKNIGYIAQRMAPGYLVTDQEARRFGTIFAHLRSRALVDYPEAYTCLYSNQTGIYIGFLWRVEMALLRDLLAERKAIYDAIDAVSTRIPAESVDEWEHGILDYHIRDTNQFGLTARRIAHTVADLEPGRHVLYGRFYATRPGLARFEMVVGDARTEVQFEGKGTWEPVRLGEVVVEAGQSVGWVLEDCRRGYDHQENLMRSVYVDEFYLAPADQEPALREALESAEAFVRRPAALAIENVACEAFHDH